MMDSGIKTNPMALEPSSINKMTNLEACEKMDWLMVMVSTLRQTEMSSRVQGIITKRMVLVSTSNMTEVTTQASI